MAQVEKMSDAGPVFVEAEEKPPLFAVTSTVSLQGRRLRTLKHGDTFAVLGTNGDIQLGDASVEGLYHRDTRHLSHFAIGINGMRPLLLSSMVRDDNSALTCDYTNPAIRDDGDVLLQQDLIHLRRAQFIWQGVLYERIAVRNFDETTRKITLDFAFSADFSDLFEVRGLTRAKRGRFHRPTIAGSSVLLGYTGLDNRTRTTRISFDPMPQHIGTSHAQYVLELAPKAHAIIHVTVRCNEQGSRRRPREAFLSALRASRNELHRMASRAAAIESSNDIYNEAIRRSIADLYMLMTRTEEGYLVPYAGIPWYSTVFGRDSLITALLTLWVDPSIARGVLKFLAAHQAKEFKPEADAEPGKILHEIRLGEMAELGEVPFGRYYGTVDATPLFVILAGAYLERTDDIQTIRELWPNIEAALNWIDEFGDRDGDGFVEYETRTAAGLANQGWKDSYDSVFHADGRLAQGPIALVEVQGYVYAAKRRAAEIAQRLDRSPRAAELLRQAEELRERFHRAFWSDEIGTYALALDGEKRPCLVQTSNAGHTLLTGIATPECAEILVQTLMSRESFSGWGIRTVSTNAPRFSPISYHNGSVWPHDNALIALGLARYGYKAEAARILHALFDASMYLDLRRLPELFCGFTRRRSQAPTLYPVACAPQAWAAAAPLALIQACLGLRIQSTLGTVNLQHPMLPDSLDYIIIRGLECGSVRLDIEIRRTGDQISMQVLGATGEARLTMMV